MPPGGTRRTQGGWEPGALAHPAAGRFRDRLGKARTPVQAAALAETGTGREGRPARQE